MSASLVGSEMCIRDRAEDQAVLAHRAQGHPPLVARRAALGARHHPEAVSYTHLTLPTICSV
eukprot:380878-Alexandrium_andersonii.AAC.1